MNTIADHRSLIDRLGGNAEVARLGPWPANNVGFWKSQNRIPVEYWPRIIEISEIKEVAGISSDWLRDHWPARKNAVPASADTTAA